MDNDQEQPAYIRYLLSSGSLKYIGKPCRVPHHVGLRYTKTNRCVECAMVQRDGVEPRVALKWVADEIDLSVASVPADRLSKPTTVKDGRGNRPAAAKAKRAGQQFFIGSRCDFCGCTLRHAMTLQCVACLKLSEVSSHEATVFIIRDPENAAKMVRGEIVPVITGSMDVVARKAAGLLGLTSYHGKPCHCGGTQRYTQRGQCVSCVDARNKSRKAKKKPAPARTEAGDYDRLFE